MVLSMDRWKGKVAIVTGASAGCGAAIAEILVDAGLQVVGLARRKEKVEQLAERLIGKPGKLHAIRADMTVEADIIAAFDWTSSNLGPVHILVNNAGLSLPTTLTDGDTDKWRKIIDTNVLGLCIATREAVKNMRKNGVDGHIVHINSVLGHYVHNVPNLNLYSGTKFAVTALTESLRIELNNLKSKIKITSVSPGPVETEFATANGLITSKEFEKVYSSLPKLKADDVADAVQYALSTPPHVLVHEVMIRPVGENVQ